MKLTRCKLPPFATLASIRPRGRSPAAFTLWYKGRIMADEQQSRQGEGEDILTLMTALRTASDIIGRLDFANRTGKQFGGKRDLYRVLGYTRVITPADYRERYERNGIAARIVETYPKATWRSGFALVEDENLDTVTPFEQAWLELDARLELQMFFRIADVLAGLGEYSALLLGVRGDLADPLPDRFAAEDLLYVAPFSQEDVEINALVTDPTDERFGQVAEYKFTRVGAPRGTSTAINLPSNTTKRVHWSRVIHIAEGLLDDKIYGAPRLRKVWNDLDDFDKVKGGGSEAFWMRVHPGYVASLDKDLEMTPADIKALRDQVEEFANQMRRTIGQRGVDFKALGADPTDFGPNIDALFEVLSASTGIPKRILMGSERGELASSQDKTNFDDRVTDRRAEYAEPICVRQFVDRLVDHQALPMPSSDAPDARNGYRLDWPQRDQLDETEKAKVALMYARINQAAGETVITDDEIRELLGLPPGAEIDELIDQVAGDVEDDAELAGPDVDGDDGNVEELTASAAWRAAQARQRAETLTKGTMLRILTKRGKCVRTAAAR